MKLKLSLVAAFVALLGLTACGGGGDSDSGSGSVAVSSPTTLTKTDNVVGTGAEAVSGKRIYVNYTGWLYNASASDFKGMRFESGKYDFVLGAGAVIAGWDQGLVGMKVGGKRTLLIPASLAYGSRGQGPIPPNSGLVFEVELTDVK